jgi:hypothetical protein
VFTKPLPSNGHLLWLHYSGLLVSFHIIIVVVVGSSSSSSSSSSKRKKYSPDISLGIATGYVLDGRGSIPSEGKIFLFPIVSRQDLRPT